MALLEMAAVENGALMMVSVEGKPGSERNDFKFNCLTDKTSKVD